MPLTSGEPSSAGKSPRHSGGSKRSAPSGPSEQYPSRQSGWRKTAETRLAWPASGYAPAAKGAFAKAASGSKGYGPFHPPRKVYFDPMNKGDTIGGLTFTGKVIGKALVMRCGFCGHQDLFTSHRLANARQALKAGKRVGCGCLRGQGSKGAPKGSKGAPGPRDTGIKVGDVFGRLTVLPGRIKAVRGRENYFAYPVLCSCGNSDSARGSELKSGKKKSCGCGQGVKQKGQAAPLAASSSSP